MKNLFITLLAISCAVVLFLGNNHWKESTSVQITDQQPSNSAAQETETETVSSSEAAAEELLAKAQNWPETARHRFEVTLLEQIPYKILIAGSKYLGTEEEGWASMTKAAIEEAFGPDHVEVEISIFDGTSADFTTENQVQALIDAEADMILLEPFTLKDNGVVRIEDSLAHLSAWIEQVHAVQPETVFVLQPPQPIYQANFYLTQLEELKKYAEQNELLYLDHWTAWPETQDAALLDYLTEENSPNSEGQIVWSEYINHFFIGEPSE
ncbi:SGNH/GDSL hydrolase family protein [Cytobacillus gottheilii]|uniref:SGNH/GDSL hydrolase family protein n=1 Tax=Cytobacillus gottheilii TaxID=859144 RepID=UPI0009B99FCA|nr:hypothetical protein [Cytobacillus gottheilii]